MCAYNWYEQTEWKRGREAKRCAYNHKVYTSNAEKYSFFLGTQKFFLEFRTKIVGIGCDRWSIFKKKSKSDVGYKGNKASLKTAT